MGLVKEIQFKDVTFKPSKGMVKFDDKGQWYGYYLDNSLVGVLQLVKSKIKSLYIHEDYRRQGIALKLIEEVMKLSDLKVYRTLALETSKGVFERAGFKTVKVNEYKLGTVYRMIKE